MLGGEDDAADGLGVFAHYGLGSCLQVDSVLIQCQKTAMLGRERDRSLAGLPCHPVVHPGREGLVVASAEAHIHHGRAVLKLAHQCC